MQAHGDHREDGDGPQSQPDDPRYAGENGLGESLLVHVDQIVDRLHRQRGHGAALLHRSGRHVDFQ